VVGGNPELSNFKVTKGHRRPSPDLSRRGSLGDWDKKGGRFFQEWKRESGNLASGDIVAQAALDCWERREFYGKRLLISMKEDGRTEEAENPIYRKQQRIDR